LHYGHCVRAEAMKQVEFMADRYRAQMEVQRKELAARKIGGRLASRSMPNFNSLHQHPSQDDVLALEESPSCLSCLSSCGSAGGLQDACAKLVARRPVGEKREVIFHSPENSLIIFDWDDTLLPTTFILNDVLPNLHPKDREGVLPESSNFYTELLAHAHTVGFVLRVARKAARVAIVTNSLSPWVLASSERYLPGLDLKALLEELQIPVYYSRRHVPELSKSVTWKEERLGIEIDHSHNERIGLDIMRSETSSEIRIARIDDTGLISKWNRDHPGDPVMPGDWITEINGHSDRLAERCRALEVLSIQLRRCTPDKDPFTEAKRIDMESCMSRFYESPESTRANVISIGDSVAEQTAIKEVLPRSRRPDSDPLCKTVSLLLRPSIQQLGNELKIMLVWLSYMVRYDKDFDIAMDDLDNLERRLFEKE